MDCHIFVMSILLLYSTSQPRFQAEAAPMSPSEYQNIIGPGFSTNYFKGWPPLRKYHDQNIQDVYDKGFRNLRLRCRADLDNYVPPYANNQDFSTFLTDLARVVDKCLEVGVTPIISWVHHEAESNATDLQRQHYIAWWTAVATKLKDRDHNLSFNLFTELGVDKCKLTGDCSQSLRENTAKYNEWTAEVITAIRNTGGNNINRILILASPKKTASGLALIDPAILTSDQYLMAEWHIYASGPNKRDGSPKQWEGDGNVVGKENVNNAFLPALEFTAATGIKTYFGAWMAVSETGGFTEYELKKFARYFVMKIKETNIPWSLNVLDQYYETQTMRWRDEQQNIEGQLVYLNKILNTIINNM